MAFRKSKKKEEVEEQEVEDNSEVIEEDPEQQENTVYNPRGFGTASLGNVQYVDENPQIQQQVQQPVRQPVQQQVQQRTPFQKQKTSKGICKIVDGVLLEDGTVKYTVLANKPLGFIGEEFSLD